jgi:hypothetical protein
MCAPEPLGATRGPDRETRSFQPKAVIDVCERLSK